MTSVSKYKIIITDPSIIVATGLESLLNAHPDYEVVAVISNIKDLLSNLSRLNPDIILFNPIIVSSYKSFEIKKLLKRNESDMVFALLYNYITPDILSAFDGWIDIIEKPDTILLKIKLAVERATLSKQEKEVNTTINLSDREKEIMISVAQGLKNKEIAKKCNLSIHTVIAHRRNIVKKTKIRSTSGQILYVLKNLLDSK